MQWFEVVVGAMVDLISRFQTKEIAFAFAFGILISSLIIWLFVVFVPHVSFVHRVKSGTAAVSAALSASNGDSQVALAAIDKDLKQNPVIKDAWRSYKLSLRPDPKRAKGYLNPVDPHTWFTLERLPGRGYEKWATTMAGVFLTLGLLFTFVGLSAALFEVGRAGSDTAQLRDAIAKILQISSAKFITSMAGIVAYIGWTLAARQHASAQAKVVSRFASKLQTLTAPVTPEALLMDQLEEARAQTARLQTLSTDMAMAFDNSLNKVLGERLQALPALFGQALKPALEESVRPVVEAIEGMGGALGNSNHAALEGMIGGLMDGVKDATGREMTALVDGMREVAVELSAAKTGTHREQHHGSLDAARYRVAGVLGGKRQRVFKDVWGESHRRGARRTEGQAHRPREVG